MLERPTSSGEQSHTLLLRVWQLAAGVRQELELDCERRFGLDVFDNVRDASARKLLQAITLARVAVIPWHFARGYELAEQPDHILLEMNVSSTEALGQITVLDVMDAIQRGTLVPCFESLQAYADHRKKQRLTTPTDSSRVQ